MSCWAMASRSNHRTVVGAAVRKNRKRAGLSQKAAAERAGLHPNYYGRLERGEEDVSLYALSRIAKALGVRVRLLVWEM